MERSRDTWHRTNSWTPVLQNGMNCLSLFSCASWLFHSLAPLFLIQKRAILLGPVYECMLCMCTHGTTLCQCLKLRCLMTCQHWGSVWGFPMVTVPIISFTYLYVCRWISLTFPYHSVGEFVRLIFKI